MTKKIAGAGPAQTDLFHAHATTKCARILDALRQPRGLNRFDAERLGDHCLNSTVAALRRDGYDIRGAWETVPTRYSPDGVRVLRYRCVGRLA